MGQGNITNQVDMAVLSSALVLCCVLLWRVLLHSDGEEGEGWRREDGRREEEVLPRSEENNKLLLHERERVRNLRVKLIDWILSFVWLLQTAFYNVLVRRQPSFRQQIDGFYSWEFD